MARTKFGNKQKVTIILPKRIIDDLNILSNDTDMSRSDVVKIILDNTLEDENKLDNLFGEVEKG